MKRLLALFLSVTFLFALIPAAAAVDTSWTGDIYIYTSTTPLDEAPYFEDGFADADWVAVTTDLGEKTLELDTTIDDVVGDAYTAPQGKLVYGWKVWEIQDSGGLNFWIVDSELLGFSVLPVAQLPEALRVRRLPRRLDWKVLYPFLHIGIPISLESLLYNGGRFIAQRYTVFMGTAEMAANAVFNSYLTILCVVASACGTLATTAVGMCLGSGRKQEAKSHFFFLMGLSTVSMIVLCGGSALLAKPIVGMYGADPDTALPVFYLMCLMAPISYTFSFAAPYGLKGAGDVRFTSAVSVFSVLFFRVGIGYVLGLGMGLGILGVHAGQYADWTFRAIAFGLRSLGKRWLNFPVHTK